MMWHCPRWHPPADLQVAHRHGWGRPGQPQARSEGHLVRIALRSKAGDSPRALGRPASSGMLTAVEHAASAAGRWCAAHSAPGLQAQLPFLQGAISHQQAAGEQRPPDTRAGGGLEVASDRAGQRCGACRRQAGSGGRRAPEAGKLGRQAGTGSPRRARAQPCTSARPHARTCCHKADEALPENDGAGALAAAHAAGGGRQGRGGWLSDRSVANWHSRVACGWAAGRLLPTEGRTARPWCTAVRPLGARPNAAGHPT